MSRTKHKGVLYLIIAFAVLAISFLLFFIIVDKNNKTIKEYNGVVNQDKGDFILNLEIPSDKKWVNDEGSENQTFGEQFDFYIKDNKKYDLEDWTLTINFNDEQFDLQKVDSYWNIDKATFKVNGLKGRKFTIRGEVGRTIETIKPKESNNFGFILVLKNLIKENNFQNFTYTLTGRIHRAAIDYPMFWLLFVLSFVYFAILIAYIIIRLKERNFEAFKENTYKIINQSMNTFASLIDTKDPYTRDHSARVSYYSVKIARKLGLDDETCRNIAYIALMHDCGKLLIDDAILTKPAHLTDAEYEIMKTHTTNGGKALKNFTAIKGIVDGAMYHHEKWDGSGYPKGLKGEEIPIVARIISVADSLDAMSSDRCYRDRLQLDIIKKELTSNSGTQFDPNIIKVVIEMIDKGEIDLTEDKIKDAD